MRDSIIALGVEDWLRKNDIKAEVHKEALTAGKSTHFRQPPLSGPPTPVPDGSSAVGGQVSSS